MEKFVELVELPGGEVVAVGPFHTAQKGRDFADYVEAVPEEHVPEALTSRGGCRLLTADALARELGFPVRLLKG